MKVKAVILIFLILFSAVSPIQAATDEGYGEDETSLGQFVDSFEDLDNVSVAVNVVRNSTSNAMELNVTDGIGGYENYTQYIEFNVDYNRVDSNLTDFPILLVISGSSGVDNQDITAIFDEIGNSYLKIAVTNTSMLSEYYVEVERWDTVNEIGILWISPEVSSLENTSLRLHFDSGVSNNTVYVGLSGSAVASNVWDAGFASVWHMGTGTVNEVDSTGNGNLATEVGTVNQVAGQIGYARDFLGTNDYFHYDDADLGIGAGEFTIETWFYADVAKNTRLIYTYDPTSGIYVATTDALGGVFDVFGVIIVSGAAVILNKGSRDYSDDTWYFVTFTRDGSNNLDLTVDAVSIDTDVKAGNVDGGGHGHIGVDLVEAADFDGRIDEMRVSTVFRSQDWRNASHLSGLDNLIYWENIVNVSIYETEGYFTTVDYLSDPLSNGSALIQLTNTSIPDGTQILVEFSEDNSTWIFNDWQPIFGGFESIDLRDLNFSAGFYIRYNLSGLGVATPRIYQSRLITTLGNISAGAPGQNVTGEWIEYRASAINASVGVVDGGDLNSTFEIDGDTFNVSEVVGAPGMLLSVNFTGIDPDAECVWITIWYLYDGNLNHVFEIEMWNFTSSTWVTDGLLVDTAVFVWANSTIYALRIPNGFLSGGEVRFQLNHETPGNINHDLFIDYIRLIAKVPSDVVAAEELFQFFWIVLAIALTMIILMIAKMWFETGDP